MRPFLRVRRRDLSGLRPIEALVLERGERIRELEAENTKLREALDPFTVEKRSREEPWWLVCILRNLATLKGLLSCGRTGRTTGGVMKPIEPEWKWTTEDTLWLIVIMVGAGIIAYAGFFG